MLVVSIDKRPSVARREGVDAFLAAWKKDAIQRSLDFMNMICHRRTL